jgi:hypothetical protein
MKIAWRKPITSTTIVAASQIRAKLREVEERATMGLF